MRIRTLKQAALLPLALFTLACNPLAVQLPEKEAFTPQRPAASLDLPITESGSAQASLDDSITTDCDQGDDSRLVGAAPARSRQSASSMSGGHLEAKAGSGASENQSLGR